MLKILLWVMMILTIFGGCSNESSGTLSDGEQPMGRLEIQLTDAPGNFDEVNISFSEISAKVDSNWVILADSSRTIDLLDFTNGQTTLLASGDVPAGNYAQIRLKIDSAEVVVNGVSWDADVPSGAQSGLKLNTNFDVEPNSTFGITIDFDASRSVKSTGPPGNPNGYKIKPVMRAIPTVSSGSIAGSVINGNAMPIAYAFQDADTVAASYADEISGAFVLAFLAEGYYTVAIADTVGRTFQQDSVLVLSGTQTDIGSILLQ